MARRKVKRGRPAGFSHSKATRRKISKALKAHHAGRSGAPKKAAAPSKPSLSIRVRKTPETTTKKPKTPSGRRGAGTGSMVSAPKRRRSKAAKAAAFARSANAALSRFRRLTGH